MCAVLHPAKLNELARRRLRSVTKLTTKVRIGRGYLWGSFLIAAAALKTPTRNGYNAQGVNLKFHRRFIYKGDTSAHAQGTDPRVALGA